MVYMLIKIFDKELKDDIYINSEKIVCIFPNFDGSEIYLSDGTKILSSWSPKKIDEEIYQEECKRINND